MFVGIDPSQRHTGVCVLDSKLQVVEKYDIVTGEMTILDSAKHLRAEVSKLFKKYPHAIYGIEKMMPSARCGALLFYMQMVVLEELERDTTRLLVHLLPIQLKSYMQRKHGFTPNNKTAIVNSAKALSGVKGRMSSHQADAYFLARACEDVAAGRYEYALSKVELKLFSWSVLNGR